MHPFIRSYNIYNYSKIKLSRDPNVFRENKENKCFLNSWTINYIQILYIKFGPTNQMQIMHNQNTKIPDSKSKKIRTPETMIFLSMGKSRVKENINLIFLFTDKPHSFRFPESSEEQWNKVSYTTPYFFSLFSTFFFVPRSSRSNCFHRSGRRQALKGKQISSTRARDSTHKREYTLLLYIIFPELSSAFFIPSPPQIAFLYFLPVISNKQSEYRRLANQQHFIDKTKTIIIIK